jgi:hypothetical protein
MIKVICIKDFWFENYLIFHQGKTYDADFVLFPEKSFKIIKIASKSPFHDWTFNFYLTNELIKFLPHLRWEKFSDFFMTLVEWREKQIDKILEDD